MKSLALYLESMFMNPDDAEKTIDLAGIMNKLHKENTFAEGYNELYKFITDVAVKEIKEDKYEKLKDTNCYVLFATNIDTDELEDPPFLVKFYDGTASEAIRIGGSYMQIDGQENMIDFKIEKSDKCDPKGDVSSMQLVGVLDIKMFEVIPETINLIRSNAEWIEECDGSGAATPANTMGMGDPAAPEGDKPGSGDTFDFKPRRHAHYKREKKDKSKTRKI